MPHSFQLGLERLLNDVSLQKSLQGRRLAYLGHPASVTRKLQHGLNELVKIPSLNITCAMGPQHGMRGEKQYNMIESETYKDPETQIPVLSLYSDVRRPTTEMLKQFDVVLVDLQDVGCRVYTYLTTLMYVMEECAKQNKAVWVLDRPNPAGRAIEGAMMDKALESFVGCTRLPLRHGLTLGEMAGWLKKHLNLDSLELKVIEMIGYKPNEGPGYGWPTTQTPWVNPSPNMPTLDTARVYSGTVLLEGTNLSDGRGTTRPLQMFGAPGIDTKAVIADMQKFAPEWLQGCLLRACYFEPTFYKFNKELCSGLQIHVDNNAYNPQTFKPVRLVLSYFKSLRKLHPNILQWRAPGYEYDHINLPIDLLNGDLRIREWVDNPSSTPADLEKIFAPAEAEWAKAIAPYILYS